MSPDRRPDRAINPFEPIPGNHLSTVIALLAKVPLLPYFIPLEPLVDLVEAGNVTRDLARVSRRLQLLVLPDTDDPNADGDYRKELARRMIARGVSQQEVNRLMVNFYRNPKTLFELTLKTLAPDCKTNLCSPTTQKRT